MSILNKTVSYFLSKRHLQIDGKKGTYVNLLALLQTSRLHPKQREQVMKVRACTNKEQRDLEKEKLSCYTPAGRFDPREDDGLIELSGLAAFDFDGAEGHDIPNLLKELKKIPHIAYAGLSCSGKRLFGIVPFLYPDKYEQQYISFIKSFERWVGMSMGDHCHKSISQIRYVSVNEPDTEFYNHEATAYPLFEEKKYYPSPIRKSIELPSNGTNWVKAFDWVVECKRKDMEFEDGNRHKFIRSIARYANLKGIPEAYTLNGCLRYVCERKTETEIRDIVAFIYNKHKESHNRLPYKPK